MNPKNNFGFREPLKDEKDYILGASPLPQIVLREDGDWSSYAPKFEPQKKQLETFNCVSFNTIDCVQRLIQRLLVSKKFNEDDIQKLIDEGYIKKRS